MKNFVIIVFISIFALMIGNNASAQTKPYSNPAFIYGSDFMSFMQSLRKTANYDMMIKFTASADVKKYGKATLKLYYTNKFTNMSKLKLKSVTDNADGSKTMTYVNLSMATKTIAPVTIVIENDSCKLVLPIGLKGNILN